MKGILAAEGKLPVKTGSPLQPWKNAFKIFLVVCSNISFLPLLFRDFLSTYNFLMSSIWKCFTLHNRAFDYMLLAGLKPESRRALSTTHFPWFKHYVWTLKGISIIPGLRCSGFCSKCRFCIWRNSTQCSCTRCFPFIGNKKCVIWYLCWGILQLALQDLLYL